jgi:hypothetical protein
MERTRRIDLCLLEDGGVSIAATLVPGEVASSLEVVEESPVRVFETLEHWLEAHSGERISITVHSAQSPIATWSTRSTSMALYWIATVLGNAWNPAFKAGPTAERKPEPQEAPFTSRSKSA